SRSLSTLASRSWTPGTMTVCETDSDDSRHGTSSVTCSERTFRDALHTRTSYAGRPNRSRASPNTSQGVARSPSTTPSNATIVTIRRGAFPANVVFRATGRVCINSYDRAMHEVPVIHLMDAVGPVLAAAAFVATMSLVREPVRHNLNALLVAGST